MGYIHSTVHRIKHGDRVPVLSNGEGKGDGRGLVWSGFRVGIRAFTLIKIFKLTVCPESLSILTISISEM